MADEIKIKLSDLKKSDKAFKKHGELKDEELEKVNGGYWEWQGYAAGYWIQCPFCQRAGEFDSTSYMDHTQACDFFTCVCGQTFAVDALGYYYY